MQGQPAWRSTTKWTMVPDAADRGRTFKLSFQVKVVRDSPRSRVLEVQLHLGDAVPGVQLRHEAQVNGLADAKAVGLVAGTPPHGLEVVAVELNAPFEVFVVGTDGAPVE